MGFVLCVLWCGLLIRTWACCSEPGQPRPRTGQAARVRNRRPACERRGTALHQARRNARKLAMWSRGLLIRTWACCSESGQPRPRAGQAARVRDRRPACGTGGPRAGQAARVRDRRPACERRGAALQQARRNARKLAMWSRGLLIRTWACCSESGQPRPRAGQAARVRDTLESKLFCPGARGRRPAREIATREPSARSDRSRSPARPCRRPRAPILSPSTAAVPSAPFGTWRVLWWHAPSGRSV